MRYYNKMLFMFKKGDPATCNHMDDNVLSVTS
jgi:hypothetical protein